MQGNKLYLICPKYSLRNGQWKGNRDSAPISCMDLSCSQAWKAPRAECQPGGKCQTPRLSLFVFASCLCLKETSSRRGCESKTRKKRQRAVRGEQRVRRLGGREPRGQLAPLSSKDMKKCNVGSLTSTTFFQA